MKKILVLLVLLMGLGACQRAVTPTMQPVVVTSTPAHTQPIASLPPVLTGTASPAPISTQTAVPNSPTPLPLSPTPTSTLTPTENPTPLAAGGPWMILGCQQLAANWDGSGLRPYALPEMPERPGRRWSYSFASGSLTYVVYSVPDDRYALDPTTDTLDDPFVIVKLPEGSVVYRSSILSPQARRTLKAGFENGTYSVYDLPALYGMAREPVYGWSPDGRYLAFSAALDDERADIYLYDAQSEAIRRLTTTVHDAVFWSWSPDSRWIVYKEARGYNVGMIVDFTGEQAVWAVSVDGENKRLYEPGCCEVLDGWISDVSFLVFEHPFEAPNYSLRSVDVRTGSVQTLYASTFNDFAHDPESGVTVILINGNFFDKTYDIPNAIYRLNIGDGTLTQIVPGNFDYVDWVVGLKQFSAGSYASDVTTSAILFDSAGQVSLRFEGVDGRIKASPNGQWLWVEYAGGVKLYAAGGDIVEMFEPGTVMSASPDGQWLLAAGPQGVRLFDDAGKQVAKFSPGSAAWLPDASGFVRLAPVAADPNLAQVYRHMQVNGWQSETNGVQVPYCSDFAIRASGR